MRLDYQTLLKSPPPLNLPAGSAPKYSSERIIDVGVFRMIFYNTSRASKYSLRKVKVWMAALEN